MTSQVRKKAESLKWDLGTVNNSEESSFRVHGLLTQFDELLPAQDQCIVSAMSAATLCVISSEFAVRQQ